MGTRAGAAAVGAAGATAAAGAGVSPALGAASGCGSIGLAPPSVSTILTVLDDALSGAASFLGERNSCILFFTQKNAPPLIRPPDNPKPAVKPYAAPNCCAVIVVPKIAPILTPAATAAIAVVAMPSPNSISPKVTAPSKI